MKTEPLIINLAPTGAVPSRAMTPHAPLQPEEIVAESLVAGEHAPRNAAVPLRLCSACPSPALSFETPLVVCLDCDGASAVLPQRGDLFTAP